MPLRLPRPPSDLVEALEAEMVRTDAVMTAVAQGMDLEDYGEDDDPPRLPQKLWLLGGIPVEGLPRGSRLDRNLPSALRVRCWRFFVGLDDGGHVEIDLRGGAILSSRYMRPGAEDWLSLVTRATLFWAMTTTGNNEARLLEFPWLDVRAVRAVGPDPGVVLDETWQDGDHGAPMAEDDFVAYVLRRYAERRAALNGLTAGSSAESG